MHLLFVKSESTFTYFEATRGYIEKSQRSLNEDDLLEAMIKLQGSSEAIFGKR
jgi:hypothetical protein